MRICTDCEHSYTEERLVNLETDAEEPIGPFRCRAHKHPVDGGDEFCHDVREMLRVSHGRCVAALAGRDMPKASAAFIEAASNAECPEFKQRPFRKEDEENAQ